MFGLYLEIKMKKDDIGQAFEPSVMCYRELDSITSQLEERMQVDNIRGRSTLMLCLSDNNETVLNFLDVLLESTDKSRADLLNSISVLDGNSADILSDIVRLKIITTYAKVMLDSSKFKGIYQEHNGNMDDSLRAMVEQGSDILLGKIIMLINSINIE